MWKQNLSFLSVGLIVGLVIGGFLPHAPIYAVATDRQDNFAIATGYVDANFEAVFFLDFLTGDLTGSLVNTSKLPPVMGVIYKHNVMQDLKIDAAKSPKFLMVTGELQIRPQSGGMQYASSVVYVAEVNSGQVAVYAMPFNHGQFTNAVNVSGTFNLLYAGPFREAGVVR